MSGCRSRQDLTFQYPCSLRFPLPAGGTERARGLVPLAKRGEPKGGGQLMNFGRAIGITTSSAPIRIDIPEGAPVHDWRLLGRAVWRGVLDESRKIETQWSAELLRDIWRQIQRESGSASQREEQK